MSPQKKKKKKKEKKNKERVWGQTTITIILLNWKVMDMVIGEILALSVVAHAGGIYVTHWSLCQVSFAI